MKRWISSYFAFFLAKKDIITPFMSVSTWIYLVYWEDYTRLAVNDINYITQTKSIIVTIYIFENILKNRQKRKKHVKRHLKNLVSSIRLYWVLRGVQKDCTVSEKYTYYVEPKKNKRKEWTWEAIYYTQWFTGCVAWEGFGVTQPFKIM